MHRIEFSVGGGDYAIVDPADTTIAHATTYADASAKRERADQHRRERRSDYFATNPPIDPAARLEALTPAIHSAIRFHLRQLSRDDLDDAISDAQLRLLEYCAADPAFIYQTDSYIVQAAVFAARKATRRNHRWNNSKLEGYRQLDALRPYHIARKADIETDEWVADNHLESMYFVPATDDVEREVMGDDWRASFLARLTGTTREIAAGIMDGLTKKQACERAGVVKGAFGYHRRKMIAALATFAD